MSIDILLGIGRDNGSPKTINALYATQMKGQAVY